MKHTLDWHPYEHTNAPRWCTLLRGRAQAPQGLLRLPQPPSRSPGRGGKKVQIGGHEGRRVREAIDRLSVGVGGEKGKEGTVRVEATVRRLLGREGTEREWG